jgi:hypothetical protein
MKDRYRAVERFWTSFYRLASAQNESARRAWIIFKEDPCYVAADVRRLKMKGPFNAKTPGCPALKLGFAGGIKPP